MTDFVLSAKFTADAGELVAEARQGKQAIDAVGAAGQAAGAGQRTFGSAAVEAGQGLRQAYGGATAYAAAVAAVQQATHPVTGSTAALTRAVGDVKGAYASGALSADAYARIQAIAARNSREAARAGSTEVTSIGQRRLAYQQLSYQIGDVAQGFALGVNPAIIFAQQIGHVTQAVSLMSNKTGGLIGFLGGPWGAVITGAVTILGVLAAGFFSSSRQTERARDVTDLHKLSVQELTEAIREQYTALREQTETSQQAEDQTLAAAAGLRQEVIDRRRATAALLEHAIALQEVNTARASGPGERGEIAALGLASGDARIATLREQLRALNEALAVAEANQRLASGAIVERRVTESLDAATAATGRYERALARLRDERRRNAIDEARFQAELTRIARQRDREIEAAREASRRRPAPDADLTAFIRPVGGGVTGRFGEQRDGRNHAGVDLAVAVGTRVKAVAEGTVIEVGNDPGGFGNYVLISHGRGTTSRVAHLSQILARRDQRVEQGDIVGLSGGERGAPGSGNARGPHVHYEVRRNGRAVDPLTGRFPTDPLTSDRGADQAEERARRQLESDLERIAVQFGQVDAAAKAYRETLESLRRLEQAGMITTTQSLLYQVRLQREARAAAAEATAQEWRRLEQIPGTLQHHFRQGIERGAVDIGDSLAEQAERAAEAFERRGIEAAEAISKLLGGRLGGVASTLGEFLFTNTRGTNVSPGSFGGLGGLINLFEREPSSAELRANPSLDLVVNPLLEGMRSVFDPLRRGLGDLLDSLTRIFGVQGSFFSALGSALAAAQLIDTVQRGIEGVFGLKRNPLSIFGLAGTVFGGSLFGSKTGSATITGVDSAARLSGSNSAFQTQAGGLATSVQGALERIAEQLGGQLGAFAVSIGLRDGKYRVDPTGRGVTRTKKGAIDFGDDEAAALAYAIMDAIKDGAVVGLSDAVRKALNSSPDIDKALREALKVDEVETLIGGLGAELGKQFRNFERTAAERLRIAEKYGFDLVKLEEINAKERAALFEQIMVSRVGALKDLLADLDFGDLFEGSLADRRNRLIEELNKATAEAEAGIDGAAQRQAQLSRDLVALSREALGTAGQEFASDLERARTGAEKVIELESERLRLAQTQAQATIDQLDEANDTLSEMTTVLRRIDASLAGLTLAGATAPASGTPTERTTVLSQ